MKYAAITPAYNEENYIRYILESMCSQTLKPELWIIVNDGSSDTTAEIAEHYAKNFDWIRVIEHPGVEGRSLGPKVVRAFNFGLHTIDIAGYEFIVKLDADISLPENYFEKVAATFKNKQHIGVCGGISQLVNSEVTQVLNRGFDHVSGTAKSYRRECFEAMGGLREVHGWDILDEHLVRYHGWSVKTIDYLVITHHRTPIRNLSAWRRSYDAGKWYCRMRYGVPAMFGYAIQQSFRTPLFIAWFPTLLGYIYAISNGEKPYIDRDAGKFIRHHMNRRFVSYIKQKLFS